MQIADTLSDCAAYTGRTAVENGREHGVWDATGLDRVKWAMEGLADWGEGSKWRKGLG